MRICFSMLGLLALVILSGCGSVDVLHPIGEPIAEEVAAETAEKFDGTWANEEGEVMQLKYLEGGKLRLAHLKWDDEKQAFAKNELTALLTTNRSANYFNMTSPEEKDSSYQFARYVFSSDGTLIVWTPRVEGFAKAVKDGTLKGTVKKNRNSTTVHVTASKEEVDEFLDPNRLAEQFEVDTPIVLHRLKKS